MDQAISLWRGQVLEGLRGIPAFESLGRRSTWETSTPTYGWRCKAVRCIG
ncbi:hypothetical protein SAVIM40S_00422 [Streptomyces avidinii]|uniref:Uncharacterized protein n=1 Tax=Streptomyces avidinii TaxID=1895 RepID=A0ABS4L8C0_STRAV|nr:hypothetical protein [Streptomyces avidinii]